MAKKNTVSPAVPTIDRNYQAEDDFRTLERAEEVRSNSSRFRAARAMGKKKLQATQRVLGRLGRKGVKIKW